MSTFVPLNLTEDPNVSKKDLEEEHTREIQIEQAYKKFQEALEDHRKCDYIKSYGAYEDLLKLDIINNHYFEEQDFIRGLQNGGANSSIDELNYLPPNLKSLRYLIFRNRGFLYYDILRSPSGVSDLVAVSDSGTDAVTDSDNIKVMKVKELFYSMMEDLCSSLIYQEADEDLIKVLYKIFLYLDVKRLAKFTLEYEISGKIESDDIYAFIPINKDVLRSYSQLKIITRCVDGDSKLEEAWKDELKKLQKEFSFLDIIKDDFESQLKSNRSLAKAEISINSNAQLSWEHVIDCINNHTKHLQDKNKIQDNIRVKNQYIDPYALTEYPMESISFNISTYNGQENGKHNINIEEVADTQLSQESEITEPNTHESEEVDVNKQNSEINEESEEDASLGRSSSLVQRSSKRIKRNDSTSGLNISTYEVSKMDFLETDRFFESLNIYLSKTDQEEIRIRLDNPVDYYLGSLPHEVESHRKYVQDFTLILNRFTPYYSKALLSTNGIDASKADTPNSADDEKIRLLDVLNKFGNQKESLDLNSMENISKLVNFETPEKIEKTLSTYNTELHHYERIKLLIMKHLLGINCVEHGEICYITETFWTEDLLKKIKSWILSNEATVLESMNINAYLSNDVVTLGLGVSVLELLIDHSITLRRDLNKLTRTSSKKGISKSMKATFNSIALELFKVEDKIRRWIESLTIPILNLSDQTKRTSKLEIRYKWCIIYKEKSQKTNWSESTHILSLLNDIQQLVSQNDEKLNIPMLNYQNIDEISLSSIKSQSMATSVLSMFSKILYAESNENNSEAIQLLEGILINTNVENLSEMAKSLDSVNYVEVFSSVRDFLDVSPIDMKLSLWNILFSYYDNFKQHYKFQFGFENILRFYLNFFNSSKYADLPEEQRFITLLKMIGSYDENMKLFLKSLSTTQWILPTPNDLVKLKETLKDLSKMVSFLYTFSIHEEACLLSTLRSSVNNVSQKAYYKLKDILVRTLVLFSIYYSHCLGLMSRTNNERDTSDIEKVLTGLLRYAHEQLGLRRLCDSAGGLFLIYTQDAISTSSTPSQFDLSQIISCRYHYHLSVESFVPTNHETNVDSKLDIISAKELSDFALPLCFSSNPLINIPKHDMKALIDEIYEVIGDPDFERSESLTRNEAYFGYFLDSTTISSKLLKDAFHGLLKVSFEEPEKEDQINSIVKHGLYYLEGLLIFSSYKVRKKNMQSRAVELDNIIKLLKYDLIFCSNRIESWLLLGQAYGFAVEDDLIWTSDKLTIPERKISTANMQRKALLCYLMAINESAKQSTQLSKPLIGIIMSSFAKEMYSACMKPMGMHCFKVLSSPRFVKRSSGAMFVPIAEKDSVMKSMCLRLIQSSLILAVKAKRKSWTMYYYLAKVQKKLKKDPNVILGTINRAARLSKESSSSSNDPIIEPLYILCTTLYKLVKEDALSPSVGRFYLQKYNLISDQVDQKDENDKKQLFELIVESLKKIVSLDKKKWHHKPRYRLSRILFDEFGDVDSAISEMSSFLSLRTTSKTLVSIWKPENERPGKHFFYTYQYARFYIELLSEKLDLISLIQMLPKLRRSNAIMISLYSIWEYLCSSICKMIRNSLSINESFVETFMQSLTYQIFMQQSKIMIESMSKQDIPKVLEVHHCYLHVLNDMKKLNNGFGPTSLIDDTIVAIFIKIYLHFSKMNECSETGIGITDSPGGRTKKLAKRDFFPFTIDILKVYKRQIDNLNKDKPDLFNEFVKEAASKQNHSINVTAEADSADRCVEDALSENLNNKKTSELITNGIGRKADSGGSSPVAPVDTSVGADKTSDSSNGVNENGVKEVSGDNMLVPPLETSVGVDETSENIHRFNEVCDDSRTSQPNRSNDMANSGIKELPSKNEEARQSEIMEETEPTCDKRPSSESFQNGETKRTKLSDL